MQRKLWQALKNWQQKPDRKPLILEGARQVGKTWLLQEFGKKCYQNVAYISCENNQRVTDLFETDFNIERIIIGLKAETNVDIQPGKTLIILDEVQEIPKILTALKYFHETAPEYHVVVAGSYLGIALHQGTSFPVGKVEFLTLTPLTFSEFLLAMGENQLIKLLEKNDQALIASFAEKYAHWLRTFYLIGGMPEVVDNFSREKSWNKAREIQKTILATYDRDFSKHAPVNLVPKLRQIWENVPVQLAKENKKFIYGLIREGARAKEYELAIQWLEDTHLIRRVNLVETPKIPLKAYVNLEAFKIYLLDIGLLNAMVDLEEKVILEKNTVLTGFKGAATEQYVLQELQANLDKEIFYWSKNNSQAEVDFLIQGTESVVPIEVKAEENLQAKSLKSFREEFTPRLSVRTSMSNFRDDGWLINVPLYEIGEIAKII